MALPGVPDFRSGAGAHRHRRPGTDRSPEPWGPPPAPINYCGFNEQPVWDASYNQ
ncbi:hypothetical protein MGAD_19430 [Mycolicibacterium gadium]|uniref:Uncharacterized protein n=1 Tax=Mycolicibacterium gadium TaxID=1794 RepID=A0A7I7WP13_MYCGU|nr:hypothetical protein MGAD_19430 [Mycolicibacterium gadium]